MIEREPEMFSTIFGEISVCTVHSGQVKCILAIKCFRQNVITYLPMPVQVSDVEMRMNDSVKEGQRGKLGRRKR